MDEPIAGSLATIAREGQRAHEVMRDKSPIEYELDRVAELCDVLNGRFAQVEDRFGPVLTPASEISTQLLAGGDQVASCSSIADRLRGIAFGLERAVGRADNLLSSCEL